MNPVISIKKVTVPLKDLEFYVLYALEEPCFGCKGHIRLFQPYNSGIRYAGFSVTENEISYSFNQFHQQEKITKTWIEYALKSYTLGLALRCFSPELDETDPYSEWKFIDYLTEEEKKMIVDNAENLKLPRPIFENLKSKFAST